MEETFFKIKGQTMPPVETEIRNVLTQIVKFWWKRPLLDVYCKLIDLVLQCYEPKNPLEYE